MYLIVFVTLVVSLICTYSQVLAIQVSRVAAAQSGFAQIMLTWHTAAISMAASIIDTNTGTGPTTYNSTYQTNGCALTYDFAYQKCPSPVQGGSPANTKGLVTTKLNGVYVPQYIVTNSVPQHKECVRLPSTTCAMTGNDCAAACSTEFDVKDYEFDSVLFRSGGADYVITFVPPTVGNGWLQLAGGHQIGLTAADLTRQLRNTGLPNDAYGTVRGTSIMTPGITYQNILPSGAVPDGSVVVIASPNGF
jgi:hypothetical protein